MRPPGTSKQLEKRRRRAVQLLELGRSLSAVASQVGAAVSSVFRWQQAYQRKGARGLDAKPIPGRPARLSTVQKRRLVTLLGRGALHEGYRTDLWTLPRVADLIHAEFGVCYHPAHVWKVLTAVGWSCQKPERRAVERNEAGRGHRAGRLRACAIAIATIRLSVCSGVAVSPKRRRVALYLRCRPRNLSGLDIRAFLQHLLRHLRGPVDLLWDRGPSHRRREVRAFLAHHLRLHVHYFPAYAPELNPAEYVWAQVDHKLANGAPDDLRELRHRLDGATRRLRRSQPLLWSCIYASDLPWTR